MSGSLRLNGSTSGFSEITAPDVAGDQTFTLPAVGGELTTSSNPAFATAWVNFAGSSQLIRSQNNVSSVTRSSAGAYRVNFTTPMDNADYAVVGMSSNFITAVDSQATGSVDVSTFDNNFNRADSSIISIVIFGGKS